MDFETVEMWGWHDITAVINPPDAVDLGRALGKMALISCRGSREGLIIVGEDTAAPKPMDVIINIFLVAI